MQDDKKSKKDVIEKLRMILDDPYIDDDTIKNKDLKQLQKKLIKPSSLNIISTTKKDFESTDNENPLKPSVIIHRKKQIPSFIEEKADKQEVVFEEIEEDLFADEELYEIEKLDDNLEEFTEIKDEGEKFEEVTEPDIDEKSLEVESDGNLPEWETVESEIQETGIKIDEKEKLESIPEWETVESEVQEIDIKIDEKEPLESIPEWEPITNEQFRDKIPKIKVKSKKVDEKKSEVGFDELNVFSEIKSIDNSIAELLKNNGYFSIEDLKNVTIKDLTKIKGIKRKTAKKIKKDITNFYESKDNPDFESFDDKISDDEFEDTDKKIEKKDKSNQINKKKGVFTYGEYTLYRKEIKLQSDKKRIIHFFSKEKPEDGVTVDLPKDYEVKTNKKTGVPYISRKK